MNTSKSTYLLILFAVLCFPFLSVSQVGINTTTPRTTLEVAGDVKISKGVNIDIKRALDANDTPAFLNRDPNNKIESVNVTQPTGVALAYFLKYFIDNPDGDWISNFDTGISAADYTVIIISARFNNEMKITWDFSAENYSVPSYSSFIQGGTWRLRADFPSADPISSVTDDKWLLTTLIFSNDLSKQFPPVEIDMGYGHTNSATSPILD